MAIVNMTEVLARQILREPELLKLLPCHCDRCVDDVLAMALNHLPPRYATSDEGQLYVQVEYLRPQLRSDILRELTQAVMRVSSHPHHPSGMHSARGDEGRAAEGESGGQA
ncbi:late competence development ComFB family protein [Alicyclobacillus vulcanalis]|uniref:Competence protein ComFB n=1 Tax=Alicyclobacillus vulcanalis TaxID=252246 RepID=A0A1N7MEJ5_9BACL|nr:late competence development ComFB family protein [Alicyclobacillus vulcanalis]SIS84595.1 competence protein ComFB [Alicyclobacillus vulcanalis]